MKYSIRMRFMLYNIRYGTGGKTILFPWSGYFRRTAKHLEDITSFIREYDPDVVGLIEVDAGSYRSSWKNQAESIAADLGHYHAYRSKYSEKHPARYLPLMNKQGNAFLANDTIAKTHFHYFDKGVKRLVIQLEMEDFCIYLVHLALNYRARQKQLGDLYDLVRSCNKPKIIAGDFNVLWGDEEIRLFLAATEMTNPNMENKPSFPSWAPKRQLDFILYSKEIECKKFWMPQVMLSDHLPLLIDFELK